MYGVVCCLCTFIFSTIDMFLFQDLIGQSNSAVVVAAVSLVAWLQLLLRFASQNHFLFRFMPVYRMPL